MMTMKISKNCDKGSDKMERNLIFINTVILICLLFVVWQGIQIAFVSNKTETIRATIVDTKYANKNGTKYRNSNWALVSYKVNGKTYVPDRRIQVSMISKIGDIIEVRYYKEHPERIAVFSFKKLWIGLLVVVVFWVMRVLFLRGILH